MPENTDHPTQKPEKLVAKIVLASSNENDVVFDPFLGCGTTSVVAKRTKRRFFGVEVVGGGYRMLFTNFGTGKSHSFGGTYVELTPGERIRYTDKFEDANLPGAMQITITLRKVACGTELQIVQEGVPAVIPVEFCYLGWQESLSQLANLVEPEIPDGP
jgi:uncharacterized protein YndB with AHSA1/START domain